MGAHDEDRYDEAQSGAFMVDAMISAGDWPVGACATACRAALAALSDHLPRYAEDSAAWLSIDIELADDDRVALINAQYRNRDRATNVLSFPALDAAAIAGLQNGSPGGTDTAAARPTLLGTVILADGVIAREAREQGKRLTDHLSHLVVHGVLHGLGYDHDIAERAAIMEAAERRILAGLGIGDPYTVKAMDA